MDSVDTRTKESFWYKQIGATEQAKLSSAMGKVQEKGYNASFPISYNINGIPTYVMSLKDAAGLIKMIAMVSVEDYTIVGVGNTIHESLRAYKTALNSGGNTLIKQGNPDKSIEYGLIERIATDIRNGNTFYYLQLQHIPDKIFVGSSIISHELPLSEKKDSIRIEFDKNRQSLIDINKFENYQIKPNR